MRWYFPWEWDIYDWLGWAIVLGGLTSFWIYDRRKL
jgi:hypothetical protein